VRDTVLSLCDYTGIMVDPWIEAGYRAILVDPQHPAGTHTDGLLTTVGHEIDHPESWDVIRLAISAGSVAAVFGFPVCTDLAVSGTARWADKRERDPHFQARAMALVHECRVIGELSGAPWFFENPVSSISSIYRKPDYTFHPYEYGGYLPEGEAHPLYPGYFPPQDAYGKRTCLWAGGGFVMPPRRPVPIADGQADGQGQSKAHNKLGGRSAKTKNIRSATPMGFARAVFIANEPRAHANDNHRQRILI